MTIGLELVDAALIAVRDGVRVASSPGVALRDPQGLLVGEAAVAAARLQPVLATDRFWAELSSDPQAAANDQAFSHADLAHAQLAQLWNSIAEPGEQVVLAVPGAMRLQQLGIALGIARSIVMPVAGVVDAAVAACAGLPARAKVLHLDIHLHQAVLTQMQGASLLRRVRVEIAPRVGQKALHGAWAQLISEAMVRSTRFDPLHRAASEQQLHLRLPGWLDRLAAQDAIDISIDADERTFTATLRRDQFALAAEAYYTQLIDLVHSGRHAGEATTLALSSRAAALPALRDRLAALSDLEILALPDTAPAAAAAASIGEIGPADPPALVTALQRKQAVAASREKRRAGAARPTHVILNGRAQAIDERPLVVGLGEGPGRRLAIGGSAAGISHSHCTLELRDGVALIRDHSRYGSFVNGEKVDGEAVLEAGDRLRLGTPGVVLDLVAVA
ncbi:MAG: FHA domain-containing protein [Gammaproteobacteria bacterium]|nr:FHA domain-containing protein [Gammaproteobacteria bacterium]